MTTDLDYSVGSGHPEPKLVEDISTVDELRRWMGGRVEEYERKGPGFEESTPQGRVLYCTDDPVPVRKRVSTNWERAELLRRGMEPCNLQEGYERGA